MAFSAVWIAVASLLSVFNIKKAVDEDGNVIEPSYDYVSALVRSVSIVDPVILYYILRQLTEHLSRIHAL